MVQVGEIVGLYLAGALAERYGYRKTLLSLVFMILVIFIVFFVQNISMLMVVSMMAGQERSCRRYEEGATIFGFGKE
ncbi:Maltose permease MAL31 [Apiospora saccharicola]|uniref:Maltose permease MAL31 n=1 Tax=Apiospora saccharicola TaxID=335842 RepID=A0ABR1WIS8_9PEZI